MQNKTLCLFKFAFILILLSGCSSVQFREGSVFNAKEKEAQQPIQEEPIQEEPIQEEPIQEEPIQEEPMQTSQQENRELTKPPYPSTSTTVDPVLASELSRIVQQNAPVQQSKNALLALQKKYPTSSGVHYHLGRISFISNNPLEAITYLEQAIDLTPQNFYAHNLIGLVHRSIGEFKEARSHYKTALKIWPDYGTAWYNLGVLEDIYFNNLVDALKAYQNYLAIQTSKDAKNNTIITKAHQQQLDKVKLWVRDLSMRIQKENTDV